jgi:hypothetical protein
MTGRQLETLDLAPARVSSRRSVRVLDAAPYAGADRLDDGTRVPSPLHLCTHESPAPWLTSEQNEQLAVQPTADGAPGASPRKTQAAIDARAGWKTIEIFAALVPVEWG